MPDDPRPPYITSGLRIGTPAVTTQGMGEAEMDLIAELIVRTLDHRDDEAEIRGHPRRGADLVRQVRAVPGLRPTATAPRHFPQAA